MEEELGKGGRFGKYGEQKRLERLRQKQRSIAPLKSGKKFPERRPMDHQKTETFLAYLPV